MPIPQFQRMTKTRKHRARRAPPTAALSLPDEANVEGYQDSPSTAHSASDAQGSENCALLQPTEGESSAADAPKEVPALLSAWRSRR